MHVFYCVLALTIAHLMRRQADHAGHHLSVRELLSALAGIEETVLLYHDGGKGRPRARRMLTDQTPTQKQLADLFRHRPVRAHPLTHTGHLGNTPHRPGNPC